MPAPRLQDQRAGRVLDLQRQVGNRAVQRSVDLLEALSRAPVRLATAVLSVPAWLADASRVGALPATVRLLIRNGDEDEGSLANAAFYLSHPEVPWGTRLRPGEVPEHAALAQDWVRLRDTVVRPELARARAARVAPAPEGPAPAGPSPEGPTPAGPTPAGPTPAGPTPEEPAGPAGPASGGTRDSREFLAAHRDLLAQLPTTGDDEVLFLLDEVLAKGSATLIEYHAYNYRRPKPVPLTHRLFQRRNPGVDPLTNLTSAEGKRQAATINSWSAVADARGGWEELGVTPADWEEIKTIRDEVVYPLLRIVLPRIEGAGPLPDSATVGQQIAHRAHTYLGVRYATGTELLEERGRLKAEDPEAADPSRETGAMDCSTLVRQAVVDLGLPSPGWTTSAMLKSPLMVEVSEPQAGDVLFRPGHVGVYVGDSKVIEAPHTGRVVSKTPYRGLGNGKKGTWTKILRYSAPGAD